MGPKTSNKEQISEKSEISEGKNNKKLEMEKRKIRFEITKKIYDEVLAANFHQSDIAALLLIPVAFLASAATFLFSFLLEHGISVKLMGIDFIPLLFLSYIFFTLSGILVFFEIIGPGFQISGWPPQEKGPKKAENVKSILFFKFISELNVNDWMNILFTKEITEKPKEFLETDELQEKIIYDFVVESYQLAKKAQGKVKKNLLAHLFFYPSFCSLFLMTYAGIISYLNGWNFATQSLTVLILAVFGRIEIKVFKKYLKQPSQS